MKKIKVLHFAPYFPPHKGGLETHAAEWANAWIKAEFWDVITITSSVGQKWEKHEKGHTIIPMESVEIVPHFPIAKFWKKSFWQILARVKKEKPDVIVTRTRFFLSSFLGGVCAKLWGIPWVHIEHGSGPVETDRLPVKIFSRLFDATLGWWMVRFSDKVIGISEACKTFIQSFGRKDDVPVIFRGVDFIAGARQDDGETGIRITFVWRLTYLKWVHILIEALGRLIWEPDWHATIVWDGEERSKLQDQVKRLGLTGRITFIGMKDREYIGTEVLPQTDIFVNPSFQEWLPTVVLEALLAWCRVIATDVGGTKEISDKADLTIIPKDNVNILMVALDTAMHDYKEKRWLSYDLIRERFDWSENIKKYYTILSEVVDPLSEQNHETAWKKDETP